ncbi:hypothetical protein [Bacteroides sp. 51]|uniref:hypothetical protein n=1 Tax=Bacteroides sp. 51 TaxID=2302938 RepID=UPI0013CF433E|nr:hypothetical protein [Bacteroides sp. 51]NDV82281.1 hypothetical protein [Bacteroides sp. 51]
MSYGGHALDMIKRLKEGREALNRRREKATIKGRKAHIGTGNTPKNLTAEEFDRINKALKKREQEQQDYFNRMTIILSLAVVGIAIVICIVVETLIF